MGPRGLPLLLLALPLLSAPPPREWLRLRSPHFELSTTAGERGGRACLHHFERLRQFFLAQASLAPDALGTVRVIAFRSPEEFAPYRLSDNSDAYYVGAGGADYIVMASLGEAQLGVAAHEYAHLIARHQGLQLPLWLAEGLAEVFSTVHFQSGEAVVGAPMPDRLRELENTRWLPLADLLAATETRSYGLQQRSLFYAESWALTHMLMLSPRYHARFGALLTGAATSRLLAIASASQLESDLRTWVQAAHWPSLTLPAGSDADPPVTVEPLDLFDAQATLAEMLAAGPERQQQARDAWLTLAAERPASAEAQVALGRLAFARGDKAAARARYQRAIALGTRDARLCLDYARLAQEAGLPESDVIAAYERALALDAGLDDAHYSLALLHMNAGRYTAALPHFLAMREVRETRAYAYYISLADTQLELGLRPDAARSAAEARRHAHTDEEREHADDLAWLARSEVVVQLSPDGKGRLRRIPLRDERAPGEVNPFIAPGDRIERHEGALELVDCTEKETRLTVRLAAGPVVLRIPDPGRVQVRKTSAGTFEFICGSQQNQHVLVEYASDPAAGAAGVLRGIELR